jgi:hypothetical protein
MDMKCIFLKVESEYPYIIPKKKTLEVKINQFSPLIRLLRQAIKKR